MAEAAGAIQIVYRPLDALRCAEYNPRKMKDEELDALERSVRAFGMIDPLVVNQRQGAGWDGTAGWEVIVGGHQRWKVAQRVKMKRVPCVMVQLDPERERLMNLALNRIAGEWDVDQLAKILAQLRAGKAAIELSGFSEIEVNAAMASIEAHTKSHEETRIARMTDQFLIPPFSILDTRQGYWQERRDAWHAYGFRSEPGRAQMLTYRGRRGFKDIADFMEMRKGPADDITIFEGFVKGKDPAYSKRKKKLERKLKRTLTDEEYRLLYTPLPATGTSGFDPVLCECAYRWFCPPGGTVLDPFAGGATRGVMAGLLGRPYTGIDLSQRQIDTNIAQLEAMRAGPLGGKAIAGEFRDPTWLCGDSTTAPFPAPVDFVFTCPPYGHLERYNPKDARDLSNKSPRDFFSLIHAVIARSAACLREDRFAVWVVGNYRDRGGVAAYNDFAGETVRGFEAAGMRLYNDVILVNSVGSVRISAARHFKDSRKMGKVHQNVLVFVKGNPLKATEAVGPVSFGELPKDQPGE